MPGAGGALQHRLKPARDAAIQRVVVPALIVRLVRFAGRRPARPGTPRAGVCDSGRRRPCRCRARGRPSSGRTRPSPRSPSPNSLAHLGGPREQEAAVAQRLGPVNWDHAACSSAGRRRGRRRLAAQHLVAGERALDRQLVEPHLDPPVQLARDRPSAARLGLHPTGRRSSGRGAQLLHPHQFKVVAPSTATPGPRASRPRRFSTCSTRGVLVQAEHDVKHA